MNHAGATARILIFNFFSQFKKKPDDSKKFYYQYLSISVPHGLEFGRIVFLHIIFLSLSIINIIIIIVKSYLFIHVLSLFLLLITNIVFYF